MRRRKKEKLEEAMQAGEEGTQPQDEEMEHAEADENEGDENENENESETGDPEGSIISKQTSAQAKPAAGSESQENNEQRLNFNETSTMAEEMERLRMGGSVSLKFQAEAYRMKNVNRIVVSERSERWVYLVT
jgi:hypothetical protein